MLIGNIVAGLFNGKEVSGEFTARVLITETESKGPRIKLFQTWMVWSTYPIPFMFIGRVFLMTCARIYLPLLRHYTIRDEADLTVKISL